MSYGGKPPGSAVDRTVKAAMNRRTPKRGSRQAGSSIADRCAAKNVLLSEIDFNQYPCGREWRLGSVNLGIRNNAHPAAPAAESRKARSVRCLGLKRLFDRT
jgi:hypothetical protein